MLDAYVSTWKNASPDSGHGYKNFVDMDEKSIYLMNEVISLTPNFDAKILDLGCNVGRCLNYLEERGYKDLHGVDVSKPAIDIISEVYPKVFEKANIELCSFQQFLLDKDDLYYATTYTNGATVELVPSSFPLIKEVTRVTSKYVCFMISPDGHWYPRFWEYEFSKYSFFLVKKYYYALDLDKRGGSVFVRF